MNLEKMHPALKERFCEQLYEKYIIDASDCLSKYEEYAETIHAKMPVSCYTNFRDALFHFRRVVSLMEENDFQNGESNGFFLSKKKILASLRFLCYHVAVAVNKDF